MTIGYNMAALAPWWGAKTLADVRAKTCRDYADHRRAQGVGDATIRRELSVLSAGVGHWHAEHGPLNSVPVVTMPDKPEAKDDWLTKPQAALLLLGSLGWYREFWSDVATQKEHFQWHRYRPAISRHCARFILLGIGTGTRPGAVLNLQWMANTVGGWVDLDRGVLHRRGEAETETKKRRPPARLPRSLVAHLRRWERLDIRARAKAAAAERENWKSLYRHVVTYRGEQIEKIRRAFDTAREFAWLDEKITPHTLRHTRATWTMQAGVDIWQASGFLGMSVKTLQDTYGHHHPDWQKEAAEI